MLSLVLGLMLAAPGFAPGDCVKHAAPLRATGIAREKWNGGNTSSFNPKTWLICFHQP
jgi:hypothetical protein